MEIKKLTETIKNKIVEYNSLINVNKVIHANIDKIDRFGDPKLKDSIIITIYNHLGKDNYKIFTKYKIKNETDIEDFYKEIIPKIVNDSLVYELVEIHVEGIFDRTLYLIKVFSVDVF